MRAFVLGVLTGLVAAFALGAVVVASGAIDMAADENEDLVDAIGEVMLARSVALRAPHAQSPIRDVRSAALAGYEHYRDTCVHCHGAPDVPRSEWASGLSPRAPALDSRRVQERSDAELFHLIDAGIRMTGMPSFGEDHDDREIWELVAFVRGLDALTEEQKASMREVTRGTHEHGTDAGRAAPHAHGAHEESAQDRTGVAPR